MPWVRGLRTYRQNRQLIYFTGFFFFEGVGIFHIL